MSSIKFHTNRQVALQMAMEETKRTMGIHGGTKTVLHAADVFYAWLQEAPMKDEDNQFWLDSSTKTKTKNK